MREHYKKTMSQKQETRRGAQCETEVPSEAWRVLLKLKIGEHYEESNNEQRWNT
jgi:hypothetical protein